MGIKKWIMKHGFGSIGDSARTIFKVYESARRSFPDLNEEDHFLLTLKLRREHIKNSKPEFEVYATPNRLKGM